MVQWNMGVSPIGSLPLQYSHFPLNHYYGRKSSSRWKRFCRFRYCYSTKEVMTRVHLYVPCMPISTVLLDLPFWVPNSSVSGCQFTIPQGKKSWQSKGQSPPPMPRGNPPFEITSRPNKFGTMLVFIVPKNNHGNLRYPPQINKALLRDY